MDGPLHKWGVGPYLDGIFSQANFGIVTELSIELAPQPSTIRGFRIVGNRPLADLVSFIQRLKEILPGGIAAMQILNSMRILALTSSYPVNEGPVLSLEALQTLIRRERISDWTAVGFLFGEQAIVSAAKKIIRREARRIRLRPQFVSPRTVQIGERLLGYLAPKNRLHQRLRFMQKSFSLMTGKPSSFARKLLEWHVHGSSGAVIEDPVDSTTGVIWYAPLVKLQAKHVQDFASFIETTCREFGFNPLVTLTTLSRQCFDSTVPLLFDRTAPEACHRAAACYEQLFESGLSRGFIPYRLPISHTSHPAIQSLDSANLVTRFRDAIDPHRIISPGRYERRVKDDRTI